jgi:hypothetical protein
MAFADSGGTDDQGESLPLLEEPLKSGQHFVLRLAAAKSSW